MENIDRMSLVAPDRKTAPFQKVWPRQREEQSTKQIAANAEFRRRWIESDSFVSEATSVAEHRKETDHDSRDSSG